MVYLLPLPTALLLLLLLLIDVVHVVSHGGSNGAHGGVFQCIDRESAALLKFKEGIHGGADIFSKWSSGTDCCSWRGVKCNPKTGRVVQLKIGSLLSPDSYGSCGLSGEIDKALIELDSLTYLDLSCIDSAGASIPDFITGFLHLTHLNLSSSLFTGDLPANLSNLSFLQTLDLNYNDITIPTLSWLPPLSSLTYLDLSFNNLSSAGDWQVSVNSLSSLKTLKLSLCSLSSPAGNPPPSSSAPIIVIDVSGNEIDSSVYEWVAGFGTSLVYVDLSVNELEDPWRKRFGDFCGLKTLYLQSSNMDQSLYQVVKMVEGCAQRSLQQLDLSLNSLSGSIPDFSSFTSLRTLNLRYNRLTGRLPAGPIIPQTLNILDIGYNKLEGPLNFSSFSSLTEFYFDINNFSGGISYSLATLSRLRSLNASSNSLSGRVTEAHLSNLSALRQLDLSYNSLVVAPSPGWIPQFDLDIISLQNCSIGPRFPDWIRTQTRFVVLDLSSNSISDGAPAWLWDQSPRLNYLNISYNSISGTLPRSLFPAATFLDLDLSFNSFSGPISPVLPANLTLFNIAGNSFSGSPSSFLCHNPLPFLTFLDLSNNLFSGDLPDCWSGFKSLVMLHAGNNAFSGETPATISSLDNLRSLRLNDNSFFGDFPPFLHNCSNLIDLDLSGNRFSGGIPEWVGQTLKQLMILGLGSNGFSGGIPEELCELEMVHIIDLSNNSFTGEIPRCVGNLKGMAEEEAGSEEGLEIDHLDYFFDLYNKWNTGYMESQWVVWKGQRTRYDGTLGLVKILDLSGNKLSGGIPAAIGNLRQLVALNLSRNSLSGNIPPEVGRLRRLDFLDLSWNHLSGGIPDSLSQVHGLGFLDLSYNALTGEIPGTVQMQTFSPSSYAGNPELCGPPLPRVCARNWSVDEGLAGGGTVQGPGGGVDQWVDSSFWVGFGVGFGLGLWSMCAALFFNVVWREAVLVVLARVWVRASAKLC